MMRYKLLGQSGLRVSELALGTMTFGTDWGWGADKATCQQIFDAFAEAGGNFIDTANNYTDGSSEKIVGELIATDRDQFVVATKYTLRMANRTQPNVNDGGNSRKSMMRTVEASLKRLNTEYIDLLYLHMWDFTTSVEEVLRSMDDLVRQGKVLYVGFSDTPAWVTSYAVATAVQQGWTRPVATQLPYSLTSRAPERAEIPMAQTLDLAVTAWGLLSGGVLTGKYTGNGDEPTRYDDASDKAKLQAQTLLTIAADIGRSPAQVAINWVRQSAPHIIPILGARTVTQIEDNLGVLDFALTDKQMARLNELADFKQEFPYSFLTNDHVRGLIFGESFALLDNHHTPTRP